MRDDSINVLQRAVVAGKVFINILKRTWTAQSLDNLDKWTELESIGYPSSSGMMVDETSALNLSAVWKACLVKGNTVGILPLILYKRVGNGKKRFPENGLYNILHNNPNPYTTAFQFKRTMQLHYELVGNAYAYIERNRWAEPVALYIMDPNRMKVENINNSTVYYYKLENDTLRKYDAFDIFHLSNLSWDGRKGYKLVSIAARSLGLAMAQDEYSSRFFSKGATPTGILKYPKKFSDRENAGKNIRKSWNEAYGGVQHSHKVMILEEGMEYQPISLTPEESQLLSSRVLSIQEVSRWFNIPAHKLNELSHATYDNITMEQLSFYMDSMMPILVQWEETVNWKLVTPNLKNDVFAEFLVDAILRGDPKTRNDVYSIMRQWGVMNADEWRAKENMNPQGGKAGKVYILPLNYTDAEMLGEVPEMNMVKEDIKKEEQEPEDESEDGTEEDEESEDEEKSYQVSERSYRGLNSRKELEKKFFTLFRNVGKKIVIKDVRAIRNMLKDYRKIKFKRDLKKYYDKNRTYITNRFASIYRPYSELILKEATEEIGVDINSKLGYNFRQKKEFNTGVNEFIINTSDRYISSSIGQLNKIADEADEEKVIEELEQRLDEWEQKRPDKIGFREAIDGNNGLAVLIFFLYKRRVMWVTFDKSCPYCEGLNGMIISEGQSFIDANTGLEVPGKDTLFPSSNITHPQAHGGCDCGVIAI